MHILCLVYFEFSNQQTHLTVRVSKQKCVIRGSNVFNSHSRASVRSSGSQPQQPVPNLTESPQLHEGSCSQLTAGNSEAAREASAPKPAEKAGAGEPLRAPLPLFLETKGLGVSQAGLLAPEGPPRRAGPCVSSLLSLEGPLGHGSPSWEGLVCTSAPSGSRDPASRQAVAQGDRAAGGMRT